jgi:hypothetical protein
MMNSVDETQFGKWLDDYGKAWVDGDPDAVVVLFAEDAAYQETPFENHMLGKDEIYRYWVDGAQESQRDIEFDYQIISIKENTGYTHWTASFISVPSNALVELDGIMAIKFDDDGKCVKLREWWHRRTTET